MPLSQRQHARLLISEILLLRADDASRADKSQPCNAFLRAKPKVLHHVETNQCASAAQTCQTMHSQRSVGRFSQTQKRVNLLIRRRSAVLEEEIMMLEACLDKCLAVVFRIVEAHDRFHSQRPKDLQIVVGPFVVVANFLVCRSSECEKLALDHFVHVSVLRVVVVEVLLHIEVADAQEASAHGPLQPRETVLDVQVKRAFRPRRVAVREAQARVQARERLPGLLRAEVAVQAQKRAEQEDRVGDVLRVLRTARALGSAARHR